LGPTLTLVLQERASILEGIAGHQLRHDASARQRLAVTGLDAADLTRRHGEEFDQIDLVLPRPQPEVQAGGQGVRLVSRFIVQGDDPARREAAILAQEYEFLRHQTDAVIRNDDDAAKP
jgi:hypothetical protein